MKQFEHWSDYVTFIIMIITVLFFITVGIIYIYY